MHRRLDEYGYSTKTTPFWSWYRVHWSSVYRMSWVSGLVFRPKSCFTNISRQTAFDHLLYTQLTFTPLLWYSAPYTALTERNTTNMVIIQGDVLIFMYLVLSYTIAMHAFSNALLFRIRIQICINYIELPCVR